MIFYKSWPARQGRSNDKRFQRGKGMTTGDGGSGELAGQADGPSAGRDAFLAAMRQAATGVTVVATADPAGRQGDTVSAMRPVAYLSRGRRPCIPTGSCALDTGLAVSHQCGFVEGARLQQRALLLRR